MLSPPTQKARLLFIFNSDLSKTLGSFSPFSVHPRPKFISVGDFKLQKFTECLTCKKTRRMQHHLGYYCGSRQTGMRSTEVASVCDWTRLADGYRRVTSYILSILDEEKVREIYSSTTCAPFVCISQYLVSVHSMKADTTHAKKQVTTWSAESRKTNGGSNTTTGVQQFFAYYW